MVLSLCTGLSRVLIAMMMTVPRPFRAENSLHVLSVRCRKPTADSLVCAQLSFFLILLTA